MSVQLRLTDGLVVAGEKDCTCLDTIHAGPHWLYTNDLWAAKNAQMLANGNVRGAIDEESPRLREKRFEMERRGIVEIIRGEV